MKLKTCRLVFDASQPTKSGFSLNDILTKGRNSINKLQEVFVLWAIHKSVFHTDISKMYSTIQLRRKHWVFQRYFWKNSLDPAKHCQEKVIKKNNIWGSFKWKSGGESIENDSRDCKKLISTDLWNHIKGHIRSWLYIWPEFRE